MVKSIRESANPNKSMKYHPIKIQFIHSLSIRLALMHFGSDPVHLLLMHALFASPSSLKLSFLQ